jgi:3-deoxy-D-manno-octulosonate 8-phosphate phosphatase (KDO 8-P phosphatase)
MNLLTQFKSVTTFVFDIDGVLTDGTVLLLENGLQARQMHVRDGLALQMALKGGYRVIIISGAYSEPVLQRLKYLGLDEIFLSVKDKLGFLKKYQAEHGLSWNEILFMGDDLPDIPVLKEAGLPCCPADAAMEVRNTSLYISPIKGGHGCVRDVIEKVLKLNGKWYVDTEVTSR